MYYQQLSSISASFAFLVEMVLIKFGTKTKFQEICVQHHCLSQECVALVF
jgi:hypothetical protein